jgi:hypothetical protein
MEESHHQWYENHATTQASNRRSTEKERKDNQANHFCFQYWKYAFVHAFS